MKCVRLSIVLLLLLMMLHLAGPWAPDARAAEGVIRQGVLIPYEITGPEGWIYNAKPHQYVLGVFKPPGEDLYPYISLTLAGGDFQTMQRQTGRYHVTPDQLVERNLYERPGARLLSSHWLRNDGEPGDVMVAEFIWSSELGDIQAIKSFHSLGDSVLVVTAASLVDDYAEYESEFQKAVMSVKVKQHPAKKKKKDKEPAPAGDDWLYED